MYRTCFAVVALLTAACVHARPQAVASFCDIAKPIYWSDQDTDETIQQAKEHNAVGKDQCGWR